MLLSLVCWNAFADAKDIEHGAKVYSKERDRAYNSLTIFFVLASFGGPGDRYASRGAFGCGKSSGEPTTATTEKATPRSI